MTWYEKTVLTIAALGAINVGLTELNFDIVNLALGSIPVLASIVYYAIGLAGIWALIKIFK